MVLKTQPATQLEEPMEELQDYAVWGGGMAAEPRLLLPPKPQEWCGCHPELSKPAWLHASD